LDTFGQILSNKMIIGPAAAWLAAQVLKTLIDALRHRKISLRLLVATGGMPSAHSALVCGLATVAAKTEGFDSAVFGISAALALIVMYDAAGVRQAVDKQSEILTHLLTHIPKTYEDFDRFLEGLVGHTRVQVVAGGILGIFVAMLFV